MMKALGQMPETRLCDWGSHHSVAPPLPSWDPHRVGESLCGSHLGEPSPGQGY